MGGPFKKWTALIKVDFLMTVHIHALDHPFSVNRDRPISFLTAHVVLDRSLLQQDGSVAKIILREFFKILPKCDRLSPLANLLK